MNVNVTTTFEMKPAAEIIDELGLNTDGDVQKQFARLVNRHITPYMPYLTGTLSTRLKQIEGPDSITVAGPYARYQHYGMAMAGRAPKVLTGAPLRYTKTQHPKAGPFWDRRMAAERKEQLVRALQEYVDRRGE